MFRLTSLGLAGFAGVSLSWTAQANPGSWAWRAVGTLSTIDVVPHAGFGFSMAISGDRMIAGAPFADYGELQAGAAYIFRNVNGEWQHEAKIVASIAGGQFQHHFGWAVSIDGDVIAVGALRDRAVHVFERVGGAWLKAARLTPWSSTGGRHTVAVGDGVIVVGHPEAVGQTPNSGVVRLFEKVAGTWTPVQTLAPLNPGFADRFGRSLAISGDTLLIARDPRQNSPAAVIAFHRVGATWHEGATIQPSDAATGDDFGESITFDGSRAIIGAPGGNPAYVDRGAAYEFARSGQEWVQLARITPLTSQDGARFGESVAGGGSVLVVGSPRRDDGGLARGGAHVFERIGGMWVERLWSRPAGLGDNAQLGHSVGFDGTRAFAGAPWPSSQGLVRVYSNLPPPCPGDVNADTRVDFLDLNIVLSDFLATGSFTGDVNGDGVVNFIDLNIVLSYYGASC